MPITIHASIMGVIERIHDPMLDQRSDAYFWQMLSQPITAVASFVFS